MKTFSLSYPTGTTEFLMEAAFSDLQSYAPPEKTILLIDDKVFAAHEEKFAGYRIIKIAGEESVKTFETVHQLAKQLIDMEAHRQTMLVGIGGGVITDITGFLSAIYMRGTAFGFVPTTLLAMVDAAIGGKNGVNIDLHKNMLGIVRQPSFVLFDVSFLQTLPDEEWSNGFAEIIKYGHIADTRILHLLQEYDIAFFQKHPQQLQELIEGCVAVKNNIVHADEYENGMRKMLNFGHTAGHALETLYHLPHGNAVGLGMIIAMHLSEKIAGLDTNCRQQLILLLQRYQLPVSLPFDTEKVMDILKMDKKRTEHGMDFILLEKPGVAVIKKLELAAIKDGLQSAL